MSVRPWSVCPLVCFEYLRDRQLVFHHQGTKEREPDFWKILGKSQMGKKNFFRGFWRLPQKLLERFWLNFKIQQSAVISNTWRKTYIWKKSRSCRVYVWKLHFFSLTRFLANFCLVIHYLRGEGLVEVTWNLQRTYKLAMPVSNISRFYNCLIFDPPKLEETPVFGPFLVFFAFILKRTQTILMKFC